MFQRILVPLDGTKQAEAAIPFARELATTFGARLMLLHVEPPSAAVMDEIAVDNRMEIIAAELRTAGIEASVVTEFGKAAPTIASTAVLDHVDLIVLTPETRTLLEGLRHPSVTADVLARTAAPILIAPTKGEESPKLLSYGGAQVIVPLDGSPLAEKALPLALRMARRFDRPMLLLNVIPLSRVIVAGPETYALSRENVEAELRETQEYLSRVRSRLERTENVSVQTSFHRGVPAEVILAVAATKPGSLLVMSSHGRTGLMRVLLGSVTLDVARKTNLPLIIVPTTTERHAQATDFRDAREQQAETSIAE